MMSNNMMNHYSRVAPAAIGDLSSSFPLKEVAVVGETSSASSNSGSSTGYRHNPYNCENPIVHLHNTTVPTKAATQQQPSGLSSTGSSFYNRSTATNNNVPATGHYSQIVPTSPNNTNWNQGYSTSASAYPCVNTNTVNVQEEYYASQEQYFCDREQSAFEHQRWQAAIPVMTRNPPAGTMHTQLSGRMDFALYPSVAFESLEPTLPKNQMVRMFIGQLPYNVTEMQLAWIMYTFGGGANMYHFERITKTDHSKGGLKVPTGCFHCHLEAEQVQPLINLLNDRLLIDETGIWVAETPEERNLLDRYCRGMKMDKTRRFQGRPYGTVVAQRATSTFDPDTFTPARYPGSFRRHH